MRGRALLLLALALPFASASLLAQGNIRNRPGALRPGRRIEQQLPGGPPAARRQLLEQQIRRGFWHVAKQRIGFTDDQMLRLEQSTQRFDVRRRTLAQQEKAQRVALRREILADTANQTAIAEALDRLHDLQRQRLELQTEEQNELATFMTPLQRAKFLALQEQVRKRMQELLRARPDSAADALRDQP